MAFCGKCGAPLPDNSNVCPSCGTPINNENNNAQSQAYTNRQPNCSYDMNGADYTDRFDPNDIQQSKILSVFSYIGILFLIPLLAAPNSRFARFHANQGLVLFLADMAVGIVAKILTLIPFVGVILASLLGLVIVVFIIIGIVNAANGKAKELPLIGQIKIIS